jgi:hypothetical protein
LFFVWAGTYLLKPFASGYNFYSSRPLKIIWFLSEQGNTFSCSLLMLFASG